MIEVHIDKERSRKILEILNGRELTADYSGFTDDEAIRIEQLITGLGRDAAKVSVDGARKEAKKYMKRKK